MESEDDIPTCDVNDSLNITNVESSDESDEIEKVEEQVSITAMRNALSTLRKGFYQKDRAGLFELHPIMDRLSRLMEKEQHNTTIDSYFKKID